MDERDSEHHGPDKSIGVPVEPDGGETSPPAGDDDEYQRTNPDSVARYYEKYYANPYYSGPKKRGWPVWATVLIVTLVVMVGGCSALIWAAWRGLIGSGIIPNIPPAAVHVGTPLNWREIDSWQGPKGRMANVYSDVGLYAADFNSDSDEEVLIGKPYSGRPTSTNWLNIYDIRNAQLVFRVSSAYSASALPWDYQGDGTMDIAVDEYSSIEILDQSGNRLTSLTGTWQGQRPLAGDIDGDGSVELLLWDYTNSSLNAYNDSGTIIWAMQSSQGIWRMFTGDIDGDGLDEVIENNGLSLDVSGMNQQPAQISGFHAAMQPYSTLEVGACIDLNGDGVVEIVSGETGYFDPASGAYTQFNWPAPPPGVYAAVTSADISAFDLDSDGTLEIAITGSRAASGYGSGTGLYVFDLSGSLVYNEEFGSYVHGLAVATAAGQEHLCVLLSDRLIIYP